MRDRFVIPSGSGRSMSLGRKDPRHRRDAAARVPDNVPSAEAIQRLAEPAANASLEDLRKNVLDLVRALKERG